MLANKLYYFSYGPNMSQAKITKKLGSDFIFVGSGKLVKHKLCFPIVSKRYNYTGVLSVIDTDTKTDVIYGAIYEVDENAISKLDKIEGVHKGKYKRVTKIVSMDTTDREYVVSVYVSRRTSDKNYQPSVKYMGACIKGMIDIRLPRDYVKSFIDLCGKSLDIYPFYLKY